MRSKCLKTRLMALLFERDEFYGHDLRIDSLPLSPFICLLYFELFEPLIGLFFSVKGKNVFQSRVFYQWVQGEILSRHSGNPAFLTGEGKHNDEFYNPFIQI